MHPLVQVTYTGCNIIPLELIHVTILLPCMHSKKERIVMTDFGHLSCTQHCCEPLSKEWKNVTVLNDAKWSHATDITNVGQVNFYFYSVQWQFLTTILAMIKN